MWNEFKQFAMRGNVMDLAVGVIIGGAFGKIVTSLVNDLIMPIIGLFLGGISFSDLQIQVGETAIMYGAFIQSVVDFLIIALSIFFLVKLINQFKKQEEEEPAPEPEPVASKEEILLTDIRDLLRQQSK
ncbi:MAG: large conductance mechanosensitive channel protein MscL [bacterium]|jgi:large conductance mechanosensitive channel|nr:large conductance mechanosensitive channel protein MscL [Bacillota bacterium]